MPPSLIISIISFSLAIITFLIWRKVRKAHLADVVRYNEQQAANKNLDRYSRREVREIDTDLRAAVTGTKILAWVLVALGFFLVFNASANMVPSQHTGIVTQFKATTGKETGKGLVFVLPWQKVSSWDNSRQTYDRLTGTTCRLGDKEYPGVLVRISGSQSACVETKIEWRTAVDQSAEQWGAYKDHKFETFRDRRINPALTNAVNEAFETHDPLGNVDKTTGAINPPPKAPFVQRIKESINATIGTDIDMKDLRVTIGFIRYNDEVQKQLEAYSQKVLENRVLQQEEANADVRKRITEKNAQRDFRAWCLEVAEKNSGAQPGWCINGGVTPTVPLNPVK